MPVQIIKEDITILAAGGTTSLPVSNLVDVYTVKASGGSVTLLANQSITFSGTPVAGILYKFEHMGLIDPSSFTFSYMGTAMPNALVSKECNVECYFDGSIWSVSFYPKANQGNYIDPLDLLYIPTRLDYYDNTPVTSTASGSDEVLRESSLFQSTTNSPIRRIRITASGTCGAGANPKTISLKTTSGVSPIQTIVTNTVTTSPTSTSWVIEAFLNITAPDSMYSCGSITFNGVAPEIKINANTTAYDITNTPFKFGIIANSSGGGAHTVTCQSLAVEILTELI